MLWELHQQNQIHAAQSKAERASEKANRYAQEISDLRQSVDRLTLACQAM